MKIIQKTIIIMMISIFFISGCQNDKEKSGEELYYDCYSKYTANFEKLTEDINESNVYEKAPTLYNDENKKIIEQMGELIYEYNEKIVNYEDYYIMYNDLKEAYDKLKEHFEQLKEWDKLSGSEQMRIELTLLNMC
ncbi:MAG: hypothetical protein N4A63_09660 [Vallitalea sp.]|nr:hypothetical protein [Vallitalea sp.]MCT4597686.1 hypothetical protein [Vallitalea sp.]